MELHKKWKCYILMDLEIPYYQRLYKWERNNVLDLLYDIKYAINNSKNSK